MSRIERFELTSDHVKLIRRMYVNYNPRVEFGAPEIDPKRPYGNSNVFYDIGEILDIKPKGGDEDDPEYTDGQQEEMMKIHESTAIALQIILASGSFETGFYESDKYRNNWLAV